MPSAVEILGGEAAGTHIALIEKAGSTSILQAIKGSRKRGRGWDLQHMKESQKPMRVYLRHPITRFLSAWAFFSPAAFPVRHIPTHAPVEVFIDKVLDHCARNVHWNPVLEMLDGCNIAELYQFERIHETWPSDIKLLRLNVSKKEKPEITYRLDELKQFYSRDLDAWESLNPTSKQSASHTPLTNAAG